MDLSYMTHADGTNPLINGFMKDTFSCKRVNESNAKAIC